MTLRRILRNIHELITSLEEEKKPSINIKIIIYNLKNLKVAAENSSSEDINLITWFDVCYWMNHLGAFCEIIYLEVIQSDLSLGLRDVFLEAANISIANSYIWGFCIAHSGFANIPYGNLSDEKLRDKLITLTKLHFREIYSLVEIAITQKYEDKAEDFEPIESGWHVMAKAWDKLKEQHTFDNDDPSVAEIDQQIHKLLEQKPPFINVIRSVTKKKLSPKLRKIKIKEWLFLIHMRNSLTHMGNVATVDYKMELWGNLYILNKGKPFNCYSHQFIILSLRLLELYLDIFPNFINNQKLIKIKATFLSNSAAT